jgi:hypothetical protein
MFFLALWARSNQKAYWLSFPAPHGGGGSFAVYAGVLAVAINNQPSDWRVGSNPVPPETARMVHSMLTLGFAVLPAAKAVYIALWIPVAVSAILAAGPWLRLRFGTRTLLIATTVIAVLLTIIAALIRHRPG